jgi:NAD(P)-dependent dehydrogenase (short-subunit alcohol dehydrogenase family)
MGGGIATFLCGATEMKHAFITGSAKRVGREIALHLAQAGYNITIHYHNSHEAAQQTAEDIREIGVKCALVRGDLTNLEGLSDLIAKSSEQIGEITLLIHNASLFMKDNFENIKATDLQSHMQVNCFAPIILTEAFVKQNKSSGQVICLSDGMNGWSMSPNYFSYALSKMALEQFITLQAANLAPNIRLNGIALGATLADANAKPDSFYKIAASTPLKCNSNYFEVCKAIEFLENTASLTGQIITLSAGLNLFSRSTCNKNP